MTNIGAWAARFLGDRQVTTWHKVESEIDDRVVTRCGRQMHLRTERGHLLTEPDPGMSICKRCQPVIG